MEKFTIETRLSTKEYAKFMLVGLYKKPIFILASIIGTYLVITATLDYLGVIDYYNGTPFFEITCGAFLVIAPALITLIAVRHFSSNPSFQHSIIYTFSDNGIGIQGLTFKSDVLWAHIIKQKELGNFLILYHSKRGGNFIDKTKLTIEQLRFIKTKVTKAQVINQ